LTELHVGPPSYDRSQRQANSSRVTSLAADDGRLCGLWNVSHQIYSPAIALSISHRHTDTFVGQKLKTLWPFGKSV